MTYLIVEERQGGVDDLGYNEGDADHHQELGVDEAEDDEERGSETGRSAH